jgi:alkylated DNA repair dioxygenase AlkB
MVGAMVVTQGQILPLQGSLFAAASPTEGRPARIGLSDVQVVERVQLDDHSWVEVWRSLVSGADDLFEDLAATTPWRQARRWMYDREVDDPRLGFWLKAGEPDPHPALAEVRAFIERTYPSLPGATGPVRLGGVGLNFYRNGDDSVAFHGDNELRELSSTLVAVLTTGAQRPFKIRPKSAGASIDLSPASGDLLVMGGRCQMDYEHGVPKVRRPVGPRISASWRWAARTRREDDHHHPYFTRGRWRPVAVGSSPTARAR